MILLGLALLACWWVLRQQHYLPWLAAGFILPSLALGAQSLMSNDELARWSVTTGILYLGGAWALAHGLAQRHGGSAHPRVALLIGVVTLAVLYRYSVLSDELWIRIYALNTGLALMYLLPARCLLRRAERHDRLERLLRMSYLLSAVYAVLRPVVIAIMMPSGEIAMLSRSGYWLLTLAGALLLSMWFMLVLLACTTRDVLHTLRQERDRDPLTHLLNRRAFFESAESTLRDPRKAPWALLVCDIDHFKRVNDTWGHAAGDQVLQSVARVLLAQVRHDDLVARFGGEEFMLLLSRADLAQAQAIARRIQLQLAHTRPSAIEGTVTASFGLTPLASHEDLLHALDRADRLLYQAKRSGRDRICTALAEAAR
ncbi:GGDEF domain-containing protein [Pseudothauera nasutitermitis]|uniref:diguanylate cyclase n=2 Tax=Pseudothauera nasutitermitis TaxID=2565930 RepID=A0A4S4B4X4_9RHOO|nr:GGDEF domain-containing protein [Pseudothauera nasutitermitis]